MLFYPFLLLIVVQHIRLYGVASVFQSQHFAKHPLLNTLQLVHRHGLEAHMQPINKVEVVLTGF